MLNDPFRHETENLKKTWMQYDASMLRDYLVADVEDPRINIQSILSRHFLIEQLGAAEQSATLREQEFRFAIFANWLLRLTKKHFDDESKAELLFALQKGADNFEGTPIPPAITQTFKQLNKARTSSTNFENVSPSPPQEERRQFSVPNYIETALTTKTNISDTFQHLWNKILATETFGNISVLEPACGSANDYRFLQSYGLAKFLDYTGFDLCEKNVENARQMFPKVRFEAGNAIHLNLPDKSIDCCFVHDLFEHLSIEAMEQSLVEICRVTRSAIALNFFSMHEGEDHIIRRVDDYHWNTLSHDKIRALLSSRAFETQSIHIATFLQTCFAHSETHNPNAYTLIARTRS